MTPEKSLETGEIGYIVTNLKTTRDAKVGDTVTLSELPATRQLPAISDFSHLCMLAFSPRATSIIRSLKMPSRNYRLAIPLLQFEPENSPVLGFGVRIGFLGLLHMDIVRERLEREYDLELVVTNPSTDYQISLLKW